MTVIKQLITPRFMGVNSQQESLAKVELKNKKVILSLICRKGNY